MQLTSTKEAGNNDTNALLSENSNEIKNDNQTRRWSTIQLVCISFVVCAVGVIVSNLDRLVTMDNNDESDSASFDANKSFGHEMLDYFDLDEEWSQMYFNWGSHGGIPIYVLEAAQKLYREIETCPHCWFSFDRNNEMTETLQLLAEYLGIEDWEDLVFVDNASQGINTVLQSLSARIWGEKCSGNTTCSVLRFSTSYPMVRNAVQWFDNSNLSPKPQEIVFEIELEHLRNQSLLLKDLEGFIQEQNNGNNTIYLAFITHVLHNPATIVDIKSISALFREYDIISCIDGAHAMGQIKINMTDLNPDIYIANGYKWFYSPRSSALMYVKKEFQDLMYPVVISTRNPFTASFQSRFNWLGLKDYAPYILMKTALEFRSLIGEDRIIEYMHDMAVEGGLRVAEIWDTQLYIDDPDFIPSLVTVELPENNLTRWNQTKYALEKKLWIRVDLNAYGDMVARFSTQIFHEMQDFEKAAYTVLDIINEYEQSLI